MSAAKLKEAEANGLVWKLSKQTNGGGSEVLTVPRHDEGRV